MPHSLHWKQDCPPHSVAWRALVEAVAFGGLVHAMAALPHLRGNYSPADVADLVADMTTVRVLEPVGLDLAGAGASVRAFRGLGPSAGGQPSPIWNRADAHLWTYREGPALRPEPKKPSTGEQLALLDWKGNVEHEHHESHARARNLGEVRWDGQGVLRREEVHGEHRPEAQPGALEEDRGLGARDALAQPALRLLPEAHEARAGARRGDQGRARGEEESPPREARGEAAEEATRQEDGRTHADERSGPDREREPQLLTLGGLRPGSVYVVIPGDGQLWWKPCLTRAEDSTREHCWFLAPADFASLYCKACRQRRAMPSLRGAA